MFILEEVSFATHAPGKISASLIGLISHFVIVIFNCLYTLVNMTFCQTLKGKTKINVLTKDIKCNIFRVIQRRILRTLKWK